MFSRIYFPIPERFQFPFKYFRTYDQLDLCSTLYQIRPHISNFLLIAQVLETNFSFDTFLWVLRQPNTPKANWKCGKFLGKFGKIVCWRPHLGEILDPPLLKLPIQRSQICPGNFHGPTNIRILKKVLPSIAIDVDC